MKVEQLVRLEIIRSIKEAILPKDYVDKSKPGYNHFFWQVKKSWDEEWTIFDDNVCASLENEHYEFIIVNFRINTSIRIRVGISYFQNKVWMNTYCSNASFTAKAGAENFNLHSDILRFCTDLAKKAQDVLDKNISK